MHCSECGHDKLVAFSCKRRGFGPSCGALRISQTAAHRVDPVVPHEPVRQWVLSLPIPLRVLLAALPEMVTPMRQVVQPMVTRPLLCGAQLEADEGQGGALTLVQRSDQPPTCRSACTAWCCAARTGAVRAYRCGAYDAVGFVEAPTPLDEQAQGAHHPQPTEPCSRLTPRWTRLLLIDAATSLARSLAPAGRPVGVRRKTHGTRYKETSMPKHCSPTLRSRVLGTGIAAALAATAACANGPGNGEGLGPGNDQGLAHLQGVCDARLAIALRSDRDATVLLAKKFRAGDPVALANSAANPPTAPVDFCLVKLMVGPGFTDVAGAPSNSAGIGIEVYLPAQANWNGIIRAYGSGGWAGGLHGDVTRIGRTGAMDRVQLGAIAKGYAVSSSDHGHAGNAAISTNRDASFTLKSDGTPNTVLWHDFAERSLHEQAEKTKLIARAYYGRKHDYAYWDGFSTGGRQGYKLAQKYPRDFDGILAGAPAFNWTRFITAELYPQTVMLRELGGAIPVAKLNAVSAAATAACGGSALGFLVDPLACRYDPTRDAAALCAGAVGNGVVGTNADATRCVTLAQADAINKIWYGQTTDGAHADPAVDNGGGPLPASSHHLWFGLARGSNLTALAGTPPFPIASAQVALSLQDPRYAQSDLPYLVNATGSGADKWRELDYAGLANAYQRGLDLQGEFSYINTDQADLSGALHAGTKIVSYHGLGDQLIMPQGSLNYHARAAAAMGGVAALHRLNRLFFIPGLSHDSTFSAAGSLDPATGALTSADKVPMPQPATGRDELFEALRAWVEQGAAPERIDVASRNGSVTMPLCLHPKKAVYTGSGAVTLASSYDCR